MRFLIAPVENLNKERKRRQQTISDWCLVTSSRRDDATSLSCGVNELTAQARPAEQASDLILKLLSQHFQLLEMVIALLL
jgi:hypothetical protein